MPVRLPSGLDPTAAATSGTDDIENSKRPAACFIRVERLRLFDASIYQFA